jgi:exodeoxyribonuclease VII large subunit
VAGRTFVTPTACGQELVRLVAAWWSSVVDQRDTIARRAVDVLEQAAMRDTADRARLSTTTRNQLARHAERLERRVTQVAAGARRQLHGAADHVGRRAGRVGQCARHALDRHRDQNTTWRRLLAAYDVERQLARGYTVTLRPDGRVVRSAAELTPGTEIVTRLADGRARSTVESTQLTAADRAPS